MLSAKDSLALQNLFKMQSEMPSIEFDQLLGLKHSTRKRSAPFKLPSDDGKVFSNYFTNVIVDDNDQRIIKPMRYRVRPNGSKEEVPTKYNVFNARIDSLEIRETWAPLFMRNHGIVPLTGFYEWVTGENGKPRLINFFPEGREIMWAPCLWDEWISKDGRIQFKSFAIITDGPPPEIERMGHDRCPIFLNKEKIDSWLNPKSLSKDQVYNLLSKKEDVRFEYKWVD
jgi:putative SOS response-associated peptidase YedK